MQLCHAHRRYLKVCEGELLYYKPEEREVWFHSHACTMYIHVYLRNIFLQQALNIIPLKANVTRVEKSGTRTFAVSLAHSKKTFRLVIFINVFSRGDGNSLEVRVVGGGTVVSYIGGMAHLENTCNIKLHVQS